MIYIAYIFSSFFLINAIPHFVHGVCGRRFQSPFASPPGVGESSPLINVIWSSSNFLIGYLLLRYAGFFDVGVNAATFVFFSGAFATAIILSIVFGRIRNA